MWGEVGIRNSHIFLFNLGSLHIMTILTKIICFKNCKTDLFFKYKDIILKVVYFLLQIAFLSKNISFFVKVQNDKKHNILGLILQKSSCLSIKEQFQSCEVNFNKLCISNYFPLAVALKARGYFIIKKCFIDEMHLQHSKTS